MLTNIIISDHQLVSDWWSFVCPISEFIHTT